MSSELNLKLYSLQKKTVKAPPKKIATPSIISRFGKV